MTRRGDGRGSILSLRLTAEKNSRRIEDYAVFVNNVPITPTRERKLSGAESERFERHLKIKLQSKDNEIRVEAFNGVSMGVAETFVSLPGGVPLTAKAGDLYLLAVGVNQFPNLPAEVSLAYAARDAEEFARAIEKHGVAHFRKVRALVINDGSATKPDRQQVLRSLEFVQQAGPEDTVVIFLASHGVSDNSGNYFFVPRDAQASDLENITKGEKLQSLIPWTAFFDAFRLTAGTRLLIVDTCQARNIEGRFEAHSLMKRSAASSFSLMLASKGDEESQEYPGARHGLFTHALLNSMTPTADRNRDGLLSLKELFEAVRPLVDGLRDKTIGPQTPQLIAPHQFGDMPLVSATAR